MTDLVSLPPELITHVLRNLDFKTLATVAQTCRWINRIAYEALLWQKLLRNELKKKRKWDLQVEQLKKVSRKDCSLLLRDMNKYMTDIKETHALLAFRGATRGNKRGIIVADRVLQYTGPVIGGDRAVRGSVPFPTNPMHSLCAIFEPAQCSIVQPHFDAQRRCEYVARWSRSAYFEVTIDNVDGAEEGVWPGDCVAIGLASKKFPLLGKQPGWDVHSYGYHSDDGRVFHGKSTEGKPFGPLFGPGDVVGCGISLTSHRIFFTLNGQFLGSPFAAKAENLPLHPVVGLDSIYPCKVNFGETQLSFDPETVPSALHCTSPTMQAAGAVRDAFLAALECFVLPSPATDVAVV